MGTTKLPSGSEGAPAPAVVFMYSSYAIVVWFARVEKPKYQFAASCVTYKVTRSKSVTLISLLGSVATSSDPSVQKSFFPSTRRV